MTTNRVLIGNEDEDGNLSPRDDQKGVRQGGGGEVRDDFEFRGRWRYLTLDGRKFKPQGAKGAGNRPLFLYGIIVNTPSHRHGLWPFNLPFYGQLEMEHSLMEYS